MRINKELLKGSLDVALLSVLKDGPLHGYELARRLKDQSHGLLAPGEGTLYPLLHKLEKAGLLESSWEDVGNRRRKYYALTRIGRKALEAKTAEWHAYAQAMRLMI